MTPREQYRRCRQLWLEALRPAHDRICDEQLDRGPWIEALLSTAADFACLRAHRSFVADLLATEINRLRNGPPEPEKVLLPPGTVHKAEASRLFLEALRTADHKANLRSLDRDQVWIGLRMALCGFTLARLSPTEGSEFFADLAETVLDVARTMEEEGSLPKTQ